MCYSTGPRSFSFVRRVSKKKFYDIGGKAAAEAEGEAEEAAAGREEGRLLHLRQEVQATERALPPRQPCSP
jgi:hypothetical protein